MKAIINLQVLYFDNSSALYKDMNMYITTHYSYKQK